MIWYKTGIYFNGKKICFCNTSSEKYVLRFCDKMCAWLYMHYSWLHKTDPNTVQLPISVTTWYH